MRNKKVKIHPVLTVRFGDRLRKEREKLGLSQVAFARFLGVSQPHIVSLEGGKRSPSVAMVEKIATRLGRDPGYFLKP